MSSVPTSPDPPRRIVSLVPSLTETIASWGLAASLVAVTDYCIAPELPDAVRVRGTKNPDIGAIVGLAPDVVVANREENRRVDVEALEAAGVRVLVTDPDDLEGVARCFETLGEALGTADAAHALAGEIRAAAVLDPPPVMRRVFCPVWRDPWIAVGTGTVSSDVLRACGLDVVPRVARYPRVRLDEVVRLAPEVVLLPDEPYAFSERDRAEFAGWGAEVHLIDGADLTWWGPRTPGAIGRLRRLVGVS